MLVSGYNNIILLPNCTMLYYVFSGPLSLRAYGPEIKFNNNNGARLPLAVYRYMSKFHLLFVFTYYIVLSMKNKFAMYHTYLPYG